MSETIHSQEPKKDYLMSDDSTDIPHGEKTEDPNYKAAGKLKGKKAIVTGGDSGIGKATAIAFAKEGADVAIVHLENDEDAQRTKDRLIELGANPIVFKGDVGDETVVNKIVEDLSKKWDTIDILVNHAGEQHVAEKLEDISSEQLIRTFQTNVFSMYYFVKAAFPHLSKGASIINTSSITAYKGNPILLDYSASNGAVVSFTRSLSQHPQITEKNIRVNDVAPGPIWTPMIPATFSKEELETWGKGGALGRPGKAYELAGAYVYLASSDSSYVTGQTIHVNGGEIVGG